MKLSDVRVGMRLRRRDMEGEVLEVTAVSEAGVTCRYPDDVDVPYEHWSYVLSRDGHHLTPFGLAFHEPETKP